ncbi:hypothetical protein TBLA_0H01060 [Henningerozyma blattae CBS 6284]|uniref:Uncharacterized protein n=1 Tax=Henningerozyma blattae (strain ATCC 34711 / CBS 6284 / DSM 70876 / NBRC 10599 / NRRL Y-10934 / UCD 77-7) TaxID=1071380 RepID=I2H7P2_HENB6|nr:hypothetical protein TBLA_0H01060 [Tetrapisispora blattae CBS 6284]CCH62394.1 hypothetical protein TBLA_0H01060 [Tetrapisispora blattae CBS 6284]
MSSMSLGTAIYVAVKPILKIYTIIFVGFLLAKYDIVDMHTARGISNMVVNAILPCLTFNKIVSNISWHDIKEIGVIALSGIILFTAGTAFALLINYGTRAPKAWFWGLIFTGLFPNISDLPIAYTQSLNNGTVFTEEQSNKGVAYSCIFLAVQSFLQMNFGLWRMVGFDFKSNGNENNNENSNENRNEDSDTIKGSDDELEAKKRDLFYIDENSLYNDSSRIPTNILEKDESHNTEEMVSDTNSLETESIDSHSNTLTRQQFLNMRPIEYAHFRTSSDMNVYKMNSILSSPGHLETVILQRQQSMIRKTGSSGHHEETSLRKRRQKSESISKIISNYSAVDDIKSGKIDLNKPLALTQEIGRTNTHVGEDEYEYDCDYDYRTNSNNNNNDDDEQTSQERMLEEGFPNNTLNIQKITTSTSKSKHHSRFKWVSNSKRSINHFFEKYHLGWLKYLLINFIRPASLGTLLGMTVALIPWVQALFVDTYVHVHKAPDGEPVLNFLIDFTSYIGNACIPLGLLMLGGTMARLEVGSLPKGFLITAAAMTCCRLIVLPIIGIIWANKLYNINWLETPVSKFVMILTWSMPSATAQVYFTAFYTPTHGAHVQLDCLSVFFLMQYAVLIISLPFVITYTLKVDMKM